ncbi:MAG: SDR family NAD(P)-dependent oxidoreductase [Nitrospinota bacterium]
MVLQGKTAIITGAASGIGAATAVRFAKEGAKLTLVDINTSGLTRVETECGKQGAKVLAIGGDASDLAAMDGFVAGTVKTFDGIHVLVNCAVHRVRRPFLDVEPEEFRRVLEVNVTGYYFLTQKVIPHMLRAGGGSVIHISSQLGFAAIPDYSPYCTSKGAVVNMTRALAMELAEKNIRVNSVAPGPTDTAGLRKALDQNPEMLDKLLADVPLHRLGRPEEIAEICLFLASDASSYVTGHNLVADGGYLTH